MEPTRQVLTDMKDNGVGVSRCQWSESKTIWGSQATATGGNIWPIVVPPTEIYLWEWDLSNEISSLALALSPLAYGFGAQCGNAYGWLRPCPYVAKLSNFWSQYQFLSMRIPQ